MSINYTNIVGIKLSKSNKLLVQEAMRRGIKIETLPNRKFKMKHDQKSYTIYRGKVILSYNSRLANRTMNMKEVTSRLFRAQGFNSPENAVFSSVDLNRAWKWAEPILPIVLKPYNGIMGKLVFVNIVNFEEFKDCFEKISEKHNEILVEKFVEGTEYRFTFVKNEIVAVANRIPASVIGDGERNVKKLIKLKNKERKKRKNPAHTLLKMDDETERVLTKHGYSYECIPSNGEVIYLRDNSNIATGGDTVDVTDIVGDDVKDYIKNALLSIPGLRACGADVLINDDEVNIIEVNNYPNIAIHHYPWKGKPIDVASKIINAMFPETKKS